MEITKRTDDGIHKIFLDPTGRHLIVCMKSLESYHLGRNNKKPKALQKFKVCFWSISLNEFANMRDHVFLLKLNLLKSG